ncbi:MAG: BREX system Lon protease-like protein BrxL [Chlorobium sp.]|nr:BREX system Lon protease-like protein BrxL [Chlorobium sp.]
MNDIEMIEDSPSLAEKVKRVFGRLAIDKRRLPSSQLQKRGLPAYVSEWVLDTIVPGEGNLTPEECSKVQKWAEEKIPGPGDQQIIKYKLSLGAPVKLLTPVQVEVKLKKGEAEKFAQLSLLGLEDVFISDETITQYPDLLRQGLWGVTELVHTSKGVAIQSFKPMQATVNIDLFKKARAEFSLHEWIHVILLSMGYNPDLFKESEQLILLTRLLPLVQKSMHLMELAPKGTGKSYLYENISPKVRLISGGNVSPAVLFVNNSSGQWGLLARFAVVVLDEVQTLKFEKPQEIVGGLKGFLANAKLTRGGLHEAASDCGLVMLANIELDDQQQPIRDLLTQELPEFLQETAFLDRIRGIIPGWKTPKLSGDSFAKSVGLKSDFFGDALLALRDDLSADQHVERRVSFKGEKVYIRNKQAVRDIASGMMKILFPHGEVSDIELRNYCVKPAVELRQLIWDQLYQLDGEYRQFDSSIEFRLTSD